MAGKEIGMDLGRIDLIDLGMSLTCLCDLGQVLFLIGALRSLTIKCIGEAGREALSQNPVPLSLPTHQPHPRGLCTQQPDPWICSLRLQDMWSYAAKWPQPGPRCAGTRMGWR